MVAARRLVVDSGSAEYRRSTPVRGLHSPARPPALVAGASPSLVARPPSLLELHVPVRPLGRHATAQEPVALCLVGVKTSTRTRRWYRLA
jgi:hypothetical protein